MIEQLIGKYVEYKCNGGRTIMHVEEVRKGNEEGTYELRGNYIDLFKYDTGNNVLIWTKENDLNSSTPITIKSITDVGFFDEEDVNKIIEEAKKKF